jgi:hypothetical protein
MPTTPTPIKPNGRDGFMLPDTAATFGDKAKEAASILGERAEQATRAVGSGLESLGETVREKMPHAGVLGAASASVAGGLHTGGKYIQEEGLKGMAADVTDLIRRNPIPALLIAAALGFCISRATSRS